MRRVVRRLPWVPLFIISTMLLFGVNAAFAGPAPASEGAVAPPVLPEVVKSGKATATRTYTQLADDYQPGGARQAAVLSNLPPSPTDLPRSTGSRRSAKRDLRADQIEATSAAPAGVISSNFAGVNQATGCASGCFPPDTTGAVGNTQFLETVNSHYDVYTKAAPPTRTQSVTLNSKMGETASFLFDPRALYDATWDRFVVIATRQPTSSTDPNVYFRLSVSTGASASGTLFNYAVGFSGGVFTAGRWIDYPILGMDQDSLLISGNLYQRNADGSNSYVTTFAISFAKSRLYNGLGFFSPAFTGLPFRIAPPQVQSFDQNNASFWAATSTGTSSSIGLFRMNDSANPSSTTMVAQANVAHPAGLGSTTAPPLADQPGAADLDTVSRAMQVPGQQVGTSLWIVHTDGGSSASFAFPRYFQINTSSNTVTRFGTFFASSTSDDWNASVTVGSNGDRVYFTYSSTSPTVNPQMRVVVCQVSASNCTTNLGAGNLIATSASTQVQTDTFGRNRWGDYSAVSLDPVANGACPAERRAWAVNQRALTTTSWGTQIAGFGSC
jgi:hypothetical protein